LLPLETVIYDAPRSVAGTKEDDMPDQVIIEVRANEWKYRDKNNLHWNKYVPYTPDEIAADAVACERAGASIFHFHAREADGKESADPRLYADTVRKCKEQTNLVLMPTNLPTTGDVPNVKCIHDRVQPILTIAQNPATRPDLGPIDLVTCNLGIFDSASQKFLNPGKIYQNTIDDWQAFADAYETAKMKTVAFLWNVTSVGALERLVERGIVKPPVWCELVVAQDGHWYGHPATTRGLGAFLDFFPKDSGWNWTVLASWTSLFTPEVSTAGVNPERTFAQAVLERGGNLSIGLGDYHYREGDYEPTNAQLVERAVKLAVQVGRKPAAPAETRARLRLT
jgi:3-keto-5-aminohexanoate cleavage enzyme